ncbi:MAG: hypothetical protein ABUS49_04100 [Acidobacteriota bacterium]
MRKLFLTALCCAATLCAANFRLYLKDGTFQLVREYKVEGDHLKFYSVERADWEEIPADLADLKRTDAEAAAKKETLDHKAQEVADEEQAAKEERAEIRKIPRDAGVYMLENDRLRIFKLADAGVRNNKGRTLLKYVTPIPIVAGKSTLEMQGEHSENIVRENRPEFFLQLSLEDSFAIVKVTPQKGVRVVERITVAPVVNEVLEERDTVQTFTKQLTDSGLYKIWPQEPLEKGEYAVVEYNEGKIDARIWDFSIR